MEVNKLKAGEYNIIVLYDETTGRLEVGVYDELDEHIESIVIENDSDEPDFNLN